MSYKKQYKGKRKAPYKRTNAVGRMARVGLTYASPGGVAWKALKLARRLADAVNTEFKFTDQTVNTAYDNNGVVSSLLTSGPSQGSSDNQRIGDSIKLQNFTLRYYGQVNGVQPAILRMIIFRDDQNKISTPLNYLASVGVQGVQSPKNFDNRFQTKVLYDHCINVSSDMPQPKREVVIPLNFHAQFNNGTQTVNTGDLKILVISNIPPGGSTPTLTWYGRLTYTDN